MNSSVKILKLPSIPKSRPQGKQLVQREVEITNFGFSRSLSKGGLSVSLIAYFRISITWKSSLVLFCDEIHFLNYGCTYI